MGSARTFLGAVAGRFFFRHGKTTSVSRLSEHFTRIDVAGKELEGAPFTPGDKVQLYLPDEVMRTYTPVTWEGERTWFIGFTHGEGPGSKWVRDVKVGDEVAMFGPRGSIDVRSLEGPLVVIGDETSVAVAVALTRAQRNVSVVLESSVPEETRSVIAQLELTDATVTALGQLADPVMAQLERGATPVFTGRAASIQALKQVLKQRGRSIGGKTRAYWAEGKRGLD